MLKRLHVKNFRSFRDTKIEFGYNNILVGPNMSGKSNLIDLFRFIKDLLFPSQQGLFGLNSAFNARKGFNNVAWRGAENPRIEIALEGEFFHPRRMDYAYEISILGSFQWGTANVERETLKIIDEAGEHTLIDTHEQRRRAFRTDGTQINESTDSTRLVMEYEMPNWEASIFKQSVLSWKFFNFIPALMRQPNQTAAAPALNIYGDNLSAWLMLLQTRFSDHFELIRNAVRDVFPTVENIFTNPTAQSTVFLASKEKFLKGPITIGEMSDGELAFLALLSVIYSPPEFGSDLCFVEEPENHLHPRLIAILVELLRQVQQSLEPDSRGQLVVTTHSPHLVDRFGLAEILIANKVTGATDFLRPSNDEALRELVASTDAGLGELYYSGVLKGA
jgi:predicted ATPase